MGVSFRVVLEVNLWVYGVRIMFVKDLIWFFFMFCYYLVKDLFKFLDGVRG